MTFTDLRPVPPRPHLDHYKKQAKDLLKSFRASESDALIRFKAFHPRDSAPDSKDYRDNVALSDAQLVIAREHGFESWPRFAAHIEALRAANTTVAAFELAADAISVGDSKALAELLRKTPQLVHEHSTRAHRATLLHYAGANGIEDYRQKTPPNIVEIVSLLFAAGAYVDAVANIYGASTTLSLVASSVHPARTGVQIPLMHALLTAGAAIDGPPGCSNPLLSALRNGRKAAAQFLADQGATLDLESAAGVGRADLVETFLARGATNEQLELCIRVGLRIRPYKCGQRSSGARR